MNAFSGNGDGNLTAAAGTAIECLIPPDRRGIPRISKIVYTAGATAHLLRAQRSIGTTTVSTNGAAGQSVISLMADPGPAGNALAANDRIAIRHSLDGITRLYTVQSISGLNVALSASLPVAVRPGDKVWNFGVVNDTDPFFGRSFPQFPLAASSTTTYEDRVAGVVAGNRVDEPLLLSVNNTTNAGTINHVTWCYTVN